MKTTTHRTLALSLVSAAVLAVSAPIAAALPPPLPPVRKQAAPQRLKQADASIVFDKMVHDVGRIFDHEKQDIEFTFTSEGPDDLVISLIKPTCGCTLANVYKLTSDGERVVLDSSNRDDMTFKPGERGLLDMTFDPKGKKNAQDRKVNIHSNAKGAPVTSISIQGFVRPIVQTDPPLISFGNVDIGETKEMMVEVMGLPEDFEATRPTFALLNIFKAEVVDTKEREVSGETMRVTTLKVTAPADLKPGTYNTTMHVRTNDPRKRIVDIPVFIAVKGPIEVIPPRLMVGNIRAGQPITRSFIVRSRGGKPFTITNMVLDRADLSGLTISSALRKEGDPTQHVVTISGTLSEPMARTTTKLTVVTNLEEHNTIELPVVLGVTQ